MRSPSPLAGQLVSLCRSCLGAILLLFIGTVSLSHTGGTDSQKTFWPSASIFPPPLLCRSLSLWCRVVLCVDVSTGVVTSQSVVLHSLEPVIHFRDGLHLVHKEAVFTCGCEAQHFQCRWEWYWCRKVAVVDSPPGSMVSTAPGSWFTAPGVKSLPLCGP